jgi:N-acetylmuramate 1-kinase
MHGMTRAGDIQRFLALAGWADADRIAMGADWSARRYERLRLAGRTAILMDAPGAAASQVPPFEKICRLLRDVGLSAPRSLHADAGLGLLLLEDYGDQSFALLLERGDDPLPLYTLATDALIALHQRFRPADGLPQFDGTLFRSQVMLFVDAFLPAARGRPVSAAERAGWADAWGTALQAGFGVPDTLLLRDYHPGNLMLLPDRAGVQACGLLDVQDAGIGPASYDLLSLLEDARRDVPPAIQTAMQARWQDAFPDQDRDGFAASYAVLGAVRHARILGRVAELAAELAAGGRSARQLAFLPRVWGQFTAKLALADQLPSLAPLARLVADTLPADGAVSSILGEG